MEHIIGCYFGHYGGVDGDQNEKGVSRGGERIGLGTGMEMGMGMGIAIFMMIVIMIW